jgi:hypothetical protein
VPGTFVPGDVPPGTAFPGLVEPGDVAPAPVPPAPVPAPAPAAPCAKPDTASAPLAAKIRRDFFDIVFMVPLHRISTAGWGSRNLLGVRCLSVGAALLPKHDAPLLGRTRMENRPRRSIRPLNPEPTQTRRAPSRQHCGRTTRQLRGRGIGRAQAGGPVRVACVHDRNPPTKKRAHPRRGAEHAP